MRILFGLMVFLGITQGLWASNHPADDWLLEVTAFEKTQEKFVYGEINAEKALNYLANSILRKSRAWTPSDRQQNLDLFKRGLGFIQTQKSRQNILSEIQFLLDYDRSKTENIYDFLNILEGDPIWHKLKPQDVSDSYIKILDHYVFGYCLANTHDEIEEYSLYLTNHLPLAFARNRDGALCSLKETPKYFAAHCFSRNTLHMIMALEPLDQLLFDDVINRIFKEHMEDFMQTLLENPDLVERFKGTKLSLNQTIERMWHELTRVEDGEKEKKRPSAARNALRVFATQGSEYVQAYEDLIVQRLPLALTQNASIGGSSISFLNIGSATFKDQIFEIVFHHLVNLHARTQEYLANDIFNKRVTYLQEQNPEFFRKLYGNLRADSLTYALQKMWGAMVKRPDIKPELLSQVRHYFNPTNGLENSPANDSEEPRIVLNRVIQEACHHQHQPLPFLHEFVETAKRTNLIKHIAQDTQTLLDEQVLWDPSFPVKLRSQSFNNTFERCTSEENLKAFQSQFMQQIKPSLLRTYGEMAFSLCIPQNQTTFVTFGIKRQLKAFEKENPDFEVPYKFTEVFNADYFGFSPQDKHANVFTLGDRLINPVVDQDGTIYTFYKTQMRHAINGKMTPVPMEFYCCDGETGDANWALFIHGLEERERPLFAIGPNGVYINTRKNLVATVDKKTGEIIVTHKFNFHKLPIAHISVTPDNHRFVVFVKNGGYGKPDTGYLSIDNLSDPQQRLTVELPPLRGKQTFKNAGNYLGCSAYYLGHTFFVTSHGEIVSIKGDPNADEKQSIHHSPKWHILNDRVFYDQKIAKKEFQLICQNLLTGETEWVFKLDQALETEPTTSIKGDRLFFLNDYLSCINLETDSPGSLLWRTPTKQGGLFNSIDSIQVSGDGAYVYGLHKHDGNFTRYDVNTGQPEPIQKFTQGRSKFFKGTSPQGTIFIQPISY